MALTDYISENTKRLERMFRYYNPITGEGSDLERFEFRITDKSSVYLPMSMKAKYQFNGILSDYPTKVKAVLNELNRDRLDHDFEFWAFNCIKIKPKTKKDWMVLDDQGLVNYKLNRPQRRLLKEFERVRLDGKPIRSIIVKARQWGGSTFIQFYMKWIQTRLEQNWNSVIVGEIEKQAKGARAMYEKAILKFPTDVQKLTFKNYQGDQNWKVIPERGCTISIGSMENPNKIRHEDLSMAHLTEVGLWKKTLGKEPKDVVQSILGTIPMIPNTLIAMESTAKGTGNYFHDQYLAAVNGNSNFEPFFMPWFEIEDDIIEFKNEEEKINLIKTLSPHEMKMWNLGATLEGIKWYRQKLSEYAGDTWRMQSEFPSTATEAFQSTGHKVYPQQYIDLNRGYEKPPILVGNIYPSITATNRGKELFKNLTIESAAGGNLSVWRMPNDPPAPAGYTVTDRYALFADIGGKTAKADYSAITVIDRFYMVHGGLPEATMTWMGHLDQDLFAWVCAQLGYICNKGLLAIEWNSLRKEQETEGDHFYTILNEIKDYYPNLYARDLPEQVKEGMPSKWGFVMNHQTKGMLVDNYTKMLRDEQYIEYDKRALDQAEMYEIKPDGTLGAVSGQKDDLHITRAGALWLAYEHMPPPRLVKLRDPNTPRPVNVKSLANY